MLISEKESKIKKNRNFLILLGGMMLLIASALTFRLSICNLYAIKSLFLSGSVMIIGAYLTTAVKLKYLKYID